MLRSFLTRRNFYGSIACAIFLAAFAVTAWCSMQDKCAAFDEPLHFIGAWTQTHYGDFRCNPEDPPLWKYYVAAGTRAADLKMDRHCDLWNRMLLSIPFPAVHYVDQTLYQTPGNVADPLLQAGRVRMIALGVVLGAAIAWWAWRMAGPLAAVVACGTFCLDPNFLAHAPLIKNDVPITLVFFLLMAGVWLLGRRGTIPRIACVSALVGVALTTKFSGLLALPILAIALLCRCLIDAPWPFLRWSLSNRISRAAAGLGVFALCLLAGYAIVWASYGFRFGPTPDPQAHFDFHTPILMTAENQTQIRQNPVPLYPTNAEIQVWVNHWKPNAVVRAVKSANEMHLLPQPWLYGFLYTYATSLARRTFLCGQISVTGWWYYFPAAMAFKTPLATLAGLAIALIAWLATFRQPKKQREAWTICAAIVCPAFYMAMAMRSNLNIGIRHVLPVYPFLFLFMGVMAARCFARFPKIGGWLIVLLLIGIASETFAAFPNFIPFFNVAAGGSRGGLGLLSDSNIDWGQNLPALAQWQREHPDRQLYLCDFGLPDPRYYGLHYIELEGSQLEQQDQTVPSGLPPVYAISAVALQGPFLLPVAIEVYSKFRNEQSIAVLNGAIYLYDHAPGK